MLWSAIADRKSNQVYQKKLQKNETYYKNFLYTTMYVVEV